MPLLIAVQKGNRNHGMIVLFPTLKDEADLGFKYNTWCGWCPSQKQAFERWSDRLPLFPKDEGLEMESEG
jgi:hypothetical protein